MRLRNLFKREDPQRAEAYYRRANAQNTLGRWEAALADYDRAVALRPDWAAAFCNRGSVLVRLGRWGEALESLDRALELDQADALAHYNRGSALKELNRIEEALASVERAIALEPRFAEAFINRGNLLRELGRRQEALASYDRAIELGANYAAAFIGRGSLQQQLGRHQEALASYDRAIELEPGLADGHLGRAHSLGRLRRSGEALASYAKAIESRADCTAAFIGRGDLLQDMGRHEEALASYDRAIEIDPNAVAALQGRGFSLIAMKRTEEAIDSYDRGLAVAPGHKHLLGMRRYAQMCLCEWRGLAQDLRALEEGLEARRPLSVPLPLLALFDSPRLHRLAAEIWVEDSCPPDDALGEIRGGPRGAKIRIGYFSADLRNHAVSRLAAELFEIHDRSRFEVIAFAFGPRSEDAMCARLARAFDQFIDVRDRSDAQVALLARQLGIDVAVDLGGFTEHNRTGIFALRAAPVQLGYLGYLGTMGAPYMDYLVADPTIIPAQERVHYAEKIIFLPSYQVNDSRRRPSERRFTRDELGLPPTGFVFSCFNASYKILPATFASWMRILQRVEGSSLFLCADDRIAQRNLRRAAEDCGVDSRRLAFGARLGVDDYLARFGAMDLFLDTLPYNAGTIASDALWSGLPVVTCPGRSFAARVGASLLTALDLPELIARTPAHYEDLAAELAANPQRLAAIRRRLVQQRSASRLFDTARFARNLESAYAHIVERHRAGQPPEDVRLAL
jgi:predicted O-linked N-acetylglucosamine transferase (SPINDLY family)